MKKIHLLVGIIPTTLCIFAPTFSLTSCGNGDKKENQLTVTYDVGSKGKIIESSSVSFNKDKQWSQITKPIVSCDESQKIDYWTKDSVQINDTDKFTSNFTATAHYTDLVNDEKHTEAAHTLATYNNLHFYLPSDYYDGSKYTFKNYSTFHEFTYTIDIDQLKPDKGIKYFWLTQSNLNNVNLKKEVTILSAKHNTDDINFTYVNYYGVQNSYITFQDAYTTGTITLKIKVNKAIKCLPAIEIYDY